MVVSLTRCAQRGSEQMRALEPALGIFRGNLLGGRMYWQWEVSVRGAAEVKVKRAVMAAAHTIRVIDQRFGGIN
jgi:hypothetical protein